MLSVISRRIAWPDGVEVKVRMGLHTGEPRVGEDRYVGLGVHKAARIAAAGHGGQVLLSRTTRELVEDELPAGVTIRDLGERRLKDLDRPEQLSQLEIAGLPSDFGQLKTLDVELKRRRRRMYAGAALIGVVAAAVAIPVFALGQGDAGRRVRERRAEHRRDHRRRVERRPGIRCGRRPSFGRRRR